MYTCPFVKMKSSYICTFAVESDTHFIDQDSFSVRSCHDTHCLNDKRRFFPFENIKPTPPKELLLHQTPEAFNLTWKSGYESHQYLHKDLVYELRLIQSHRNGEKAFNLSSDSPSIKVPQHDPDIKYCIKVKSKPNENTEYKGSWSEWSPLKCSRTIASKEENIFLILCQTVGPSFVAIAFLVLLFYHPTTRSKIKSIFHVPSPVPFFEPLFKGHDGNLQKWLWSQGGTITSTFEPEEVLSFDTIIFVSPPVTKAPEVEDASAADNALPHGRTSYVGLPGTDWAGISLNVNSQEDTPFTSLTWPCSGFSNGEADIVTSLTKGFFDTINADSGCGCIELTHGLVGSLPNTPTNSDALHFCGDYCVLNKTPEGIVPILVPRASDVNAPSETASAKKVSECHPSLPLLAPNCFLSDTETNIQVSTVSYLKQSQIVSLAVN